MAKIFNETRRYAAVPDEAMVIRVAGLPMDVLQQLRFQRTMELIAKLLEAEQILQAQAEPLSDALYRVIGAVEDKRVRGCLMALRRAIYQTQMPKQRDRTEQVWAALPEELAARIAVWMSQMEERQQHLSSGEAVLEAEWGEKRCELRRIARDKTFQQGLVLASNDLYIDLAKWLRAGAQDPSFADRQLEVGLMTYLSRAATKTSPFSTFTSSGRGQWVDGGPAFVAARQWSRRSAVELNQVIMQYILRALTGWPEIRARLLVQINSSLVEEGESLSFLGWKRKEAMIRLARSPTLRQILCVVREAATPSYEIIVQTLARLDGAQRTAEIAGFLDQLIERGLLEVHLPISDQSPDHLGQLLTWMQSLQGQRVERITDLLQTLYTSVQLYITEPASARFELLKGVATTLESIYQELGASQWGIEVPQKNSIYEDTLVEAINGHYARKHWREPLENLALIQQLSGLYSIYLPARLAVTSFFVDHYGSGARISLLRFYEAICKEGRQPGAWRPGYQVSGVHVRQMLDDLDAQAPTRLAELEQVLQLRQEIAHWIEQQPINGAGLRQLDPTKLRAFVANLPSFILSTPSLAFYYQILLKDDAPYLVVNSLHSGFGRSQARLQRLENRVERRAEGVAQNSEQAPDEPIWVEIAGAFYSNANLRAAHAAYEIAYPGVVSNRPVDEQLALADLSVVHNPQTGRLHLISERLGREIVPAHLGLMADFWLPPLYRFLLRAFSVGPVSPSHFSAHLPGMFKVDAQQPLKQYPRLAVGRVILERATWVVDAQQLPKRAKGMPAFEYMLHVQRWLMQHHLPRQCFVRVLFEPAAASTSWTRIVPALKAIHKTRKPLYIDFSNYLSVLMFEQFINQKCRALLMQEVLPDQADLVIADNEASYVSEYILELTLKEVA